MAYRLARRARLDILDIWNYIAGDNVAAADRFVDALTRRFQVLGDNPYAGRARDDLRAGYRSFPVGEYLTFYRVLDDGNVAILRVIHGRRDLDGAIT